MNHAKARRENMRWTILLTLNNSRPIGAHEGLVLSTVAGVFPDVTAQELRVELDYLEEREVIKIDKQPSGIWWSELNRIGIDLVEYTIPCEPGIARPENYWGKL